MCGRGTTALKILNIITISIDFTVITSLSKTVFIVGLIINQFGYIITDKRSLR